LLDEALKARFAFLLLETPTSAKRVGAVHIFTMIASPQQPYLTPDRYLQMEDVSNIKQEYIDGQVYAMAGASDPHITIALNLASDLRTHVRGSGCRVYISDMKVRIESLNRFYYPDVMVTIVILYSILRT
jgi:Uma2 family endonuclease